MQFCHFWAVTYLCQTFIKKYFAIPFQTNVRPIPAASDTLFTISVLESAERFILLSKFRVDIMYHYFLTTTNWLSPRFFFTTEPGCCSAIMLHQNAEIVHQQTTL
jgi:hypothetical protein